MSSPARYVLVIEGDLESASGIAHELYEAGFTPRLATTAEEVAADVEGHPFPVCILLSLDCSEADGILERVKAFASWQHVPVVLMAEPTAPEIPGHLEIDAVISKPPAPGAIARIAESFAASGSSGAVQRFAYAPVAPTA